MNEQEVRELLKLVRGIEHFLERCLKTMTEKQLKSQGIEIVEKGESLFVPEDMTGFEF